MANISDVYGITFEASSEELAIALLAYFKKLEESDVEYNTTIDAKRDGLSIDGGWASGRWVYSNNLEGTFERPEQWLGQLPAEWQPVLDLLKAGETINFSYSEDEPGCEVYQDGAGNVEFHNGKVQVSIDFEEHAKPACEMVEIDGQWYCEDHDCTQKESADYCDFELDLVA